MAPTQKKSTASAAKSRSRLDFSTFAGIAIALAGILGGLVLEKGDIADVAQFTAALIVLGGTCGAVLVTTPMPIARRAVKALRGILFEDAGNVADVVQKLVDFATESRRSGIVSLEREVQTIPDPFMKKAMTLAVDGAALQDLRRMMDVDIGILEHNAESEAKVWEAAGGYAPTIGIIGAVMGLIQVMKHLEDIRVVGHGIAVAFVATVYGVGAANILFLPIAAKLRARLREKVLMREMILEGISGIAQGMNPTLVRLKLEAYLPDGGGAKDKTKKTGAAAAGGRVREAA